MPVIVQAPTVADEGWTKILRMAGDGVHCSMVVMLVGGDHRVGRVGDGAVPECAVERPAPVGIEDDPGPIRRLRAGKKNVRST